VATGEGVCPGSGTSFALALKVEERTRAANTRATGSRMPAMPNRTVRDRFNVAEVTFEWFRRTSREG
jgi:hypothetical protein